MSIMLLITHVSVWSKSFCSDVNIDARLGYSVGGTAPVGMPATIRKLNSYTLQPNFLIGADFTKPLDNHWGLLLGLQFENKGMETDAKVKNYHMQITRGGETLEGVFTGNVNTHVRQWMFTIPLQASYKICEIWGLRFGPYISYVVNHCFDGSAYDGYLRVGDPTGAKVELGSGDSERGTYDFSEHMRRVQYGLDLGVDWHSCHRFGAFADLSWGLNGIHHSNFKTIEQTLYPIYGTIGITYKFK